MTIRQRDDHEEVVFDQLDAVSRTSPEVAAS